jgi:predicted ATPase
MAQNTAEKLVSFDAEKASRYLERSFGLFLGDPPDSDYQRGYLAALLTLYREGLGKGRDDARLELLDRMTGEA